jgi:hypothetical protein
LMDQHYGNTTALEEEAEAMKFLLIQQRESTLLRNDDTRYQKGKVVIHIRLDKPIWNCIKQE